MLWQEGWVWIVLGVALAVLEVIVPVYVFLGFSAGAIVVGLLIWAGILGAGLPVLILVFAVVSLVSWIVMRKVFGLRHGQVKIWDRDINE